MEQFVVKGGSPLNGSVSIGGAKNAALGILAAAIMSDETVTIENVPNVRDTRVLLQAIQGIGAKVKYLDNNTVEINGSTINDVVVDYDYIKKIRASYYLLGALLGKKHESNVALPGGCNIGSRPIDQHLKGFRALGAKDDIDKGMVHVKAEHLVGAHIYFDVVTVGATINLMMAACMAEGSTILENAAKEPHVVDVANFLNAMGANIKGAGTDVIRIKGVESLHGCTYSIIPDQIEAGTFMMAAATTHGDITVCDVIPKHLESISAKLLEMGCTIIEGDDSVRVIATDRTLKATNVKTLPYPGFPTDMQPQMAIALAVAEGNSMVTESIFENRFKYVDELARMGAKIKVEGNTAYIEGIEKFSGADVSAPDLRAGAALVVAALSADGFSVIDDIEYIQRGYENFEKKLTSLGGNIEKVDNERDLQKFKLKIG
ncbi:UDP-N-acetylglucosamine 1-carboxyvinyltransferase [Lachnospira pectinoschiza]|uniref:UDP-N-acetylglucosamine 1-carboxyvinyltransferase n=1 Tax=Lachnospira pectinoschiza TaxID=28052 RepID=A0A1G9T6W3_9FIRM|nr:UDP-N-acetylglucosamine 1-carboxyvinyltransferase [Lachnospira pectinoschiza]SDM43387.1 UDP-N-acetylglucosamine 1-carboxyvinyltransferase [Lachnospira pectinoschiza]